MALLSSSPKWPTLPDYFHDWALVDVETSGLRPGRDRVLSLAILTLDAHGNRTGEFSTLLNPGCDPGPVHIHGLTPARLAGAPTFEEIAPQVGALLSSRVLVAHNAQFDYDFLAHEFAHVRSWVPVGRRLCTLALNRLVGPATPDLKLGTLAAHYGVRQEKAHDAQDDVRVLSGILRGSLGAAERLGLALPLLDCPPRQDYKPYVPKTPCAYRNPGRLTSGGPLVQGMKVAITGDTQVSREELVARSVAAGLNMMTSVSGRTSVVVTNDPGAASGKLRRAADEGVPLVDEPTYLRLLESVRPGQAKGTARQSRAAETPAGATTAQPEPVPGVPAQRAATPPTPTAPADQSLTGRRVLVLGGPHEAAAQARARAVALGASAAVNLSAGVSDVVVLPGGEADRRMTRIAALGLRVHDADWLLAPTPAPAQSAVGNQPDTAEVLVRGAVIDLSDTGTPWTVAATWRQQTACDVDVVAFALDAQEQVPGDEDFVFYGAPEHPDGTVRLATDGPTEQAVTADLERLPLEIHRVVIAAAIDGAATFSDVGAVEITATCGIGAAPTARATLDAATTERTMILAELYRRGEGWRLRAVGQGYDHGLGDLARGYGVDVAE
ncbi:MULTISPECIES: TerD family protein [unclassified Streptomyces]|uniref:TerD family protein n=1 Tax=unclassified Streptomyces TaxID=2593676 RepID=UPI002367270C|nr:MULTISPECIES: TerD family protein [unclassified Streptomyces]MDF3143510.1 TerD family protein [Streptomyces sp. T21Q-yed]WDF41969.1 TerD family protein [Streptomyces sp. T12]